MPYKDPKRARKYGAAYHRAWNKAHVKRRLSQRLKKSYGITLRERYLLLEVQGGRCAICGTTTPTKIGWCVDHDHTTKKIRGLLCARCNHGLGNFNDSLTVLWKAIQYLLKARRM